LRKGKRFHSAEDGGTCRGARKSGRTPEKKGNGSKRGELAVETDKGSRRAVKKG